MSEWTDELKEQVKKDYLEAEPTPETSSEIVEKIAKDIGKTVNGVRTILSRAKVYITKANTPKVTEEGTKTSRVNKADAIGKLESLITVNSLTLDSGITSKLTGKAAVYFASLIETLTTKEA